MVLPSLRDSFPFHPEDPALKCWAILGGIASDTQSKCRSPFAMRAGSNAPHALPPMPEPEPQPPQPHAIPAWRWLLLLLLPSLIAMAYPAYYQITRMLKADLPLAKSPLDVMGPSWALAAVLSFVLGFLMEKWRWGAVTELDRPLGNGFAILFVNVFITFAGCAAIASYRP